MWADDVILSMKRFQIIFLKTFPYVASFALVFALMLFGSQTKADDNKTSIAASFDESNFVVTSDQVSESYTVANIASTIALPSTSTISENYATVNNIYESTGTVSTTDTTVVEKPSVIDTSNLNRGVITHVVADGETLDSLIKTYDLKATKDQIRWSNGMKKEDLTVGSTIYLPSVAGIIYTTKDGDTVDSLASKYKSNAAEIISYNDLEGSSLTSGKMILLPGGVLPEKERPEYVAPTPRPVYTYTYVSDSGNRHNMTEVGSYSYWASVYKSTSWQNNPGAFGNCTWFVWYWRRNNMSSEYWLPTGAIGNARSWISTLGGSYYTGRTPAYGAVMQSTSGYYGHVAVVTGISAGNSITIQEMNISGPNGKYNHVYQSTMDWSDALSYNYIYAHK